MLASDEDAEDLFRVALQTDLTGRALERGRLQLAFGEWLRRRRRAAESRPVLRAARETFDALAVTAWRERAARELRAAGEATPDREPDALGDLTARGHGTTTFRSEATFRNAQQSAVAADVIALMDALKIGRAVIGGFDWGSRTAAVAAVAALWPQRCKALVLVSGYLITNLKTQRDPLPPAAELGWWYQYYFSTERGVLGYTRNTDEFDKLIWQTVSPKWHFDDATHQRTAQSFTNPDHVAIVIHNYRRRLGLAPGEPQYDRLEAKLRQNPAIALPTITVAPDFDTPAAYGSAYRKQFTGKYDHRVLPGIGHNVPPGSARGLHKSHRGRGPALSTVAPWATRASATADHREIRSSALKTWSGCRSARP